MAAPVNPSAAQFIDSTFWTAEVYNRWADLATAWATYTTTWTGSTTNPSIGNGTLAAAWKRWDTSKMVQIRIRMTAGSTTTYGSGQWSFSLPSGLTLPVASAIHGHILDASASNNRYACTGYVTNTGSGVVERIATGGTLGVSSTIPMTWATGDTLILGGTFEIS